MRTTAVQKIPFDYDEFRTKRTILYFPSIDDVAHFQDNFHQHWYKCHYHTGGAEDLVFYYRTMNGDQAFRFVYGEWYNRGYHHTYDSGYADYIRMVYKADQVRLPVQIEVGDLL